MMRRTLSVLGLGLGLLLGACGGPPSPGTAAQNSAGNTPRAGEAPGATPGGGAAASPPGVTSAHGGAGGPVNAAAPEKPPIDTAELDAKIEKAAAKAKARGAAEADRKAAVEAYLARGNVYWSAGDKRLYRYALGDFRRVLRYEPGNAEAKEKIATIESIYASLGRPVPDNGLEP